MERGTGLEPVNSVLSGLPSNGDRRFTTKLTQRYIYYSTLRVPRANLTTFRYWVLDQFHWLNPPPVLKFKKEAFMAMSNGCSNAWGGEGYTAGYKSIKGTIPCIPACPAGISAGIRNPFNYLYRLGYERGQQAAEA